MNLIFLSSNQHKIDEVKSIIESEDIKITPCCEKINEIQSEDMREIVIDKSLKAFRRIGHPLLVEQTGLLLGELSDLPGGLTQIFWDALQAERFCKYFSNSGTTKVKAKTVLAFCDGMKVHTFEGNIDGLIVDTPRGSRDFQWDCVFQPEGYSETFAEMGDKKNRISMRKIALEKFKKYLERAK